MEERERAKGNTDSETRPGRSAGPGVSSGLDRVREVAEGIRTRGSRRCCTTSAGAPVDGLCGDQPEEAAPGVDGVTWGLRAGPAGNLGTCTAGYSRGLPGEPVSEGVHTEAGRAAAAARHRHAGGQDRPAGGRGGAQRCVRGGLPGLLLRVPARARPASRRWMRWRPGSQRR